MKTKANLTYIIFHVLAGTPIRGCDQTLLDYLTQLINFRNVYSSRSIVIFTVSMFSWAAYHLVNVGKQLALPKKVEEEVDLEEDVSTVDLPLSILFLAGVMMLLLVAQFHRNLALRWIHPKT